MCAGAICAAVISVLLYPGVADVKYVGVDTEREVSSEPPANRRRLQKCKREHLETAVTKAVTFRLERVWNQIVKALVCYAII